MVKSSVIVGAAATCCLAGARGVSAFDSHIAIARITGSGLMPNVQGTVVFEEVSFKAVDVTVNITGCTPGTHGFHVHQYGDMRKKVDGGQVTLAYVGKHFIPMCTNDAGANQCENDQVHGNVGDTKRQPGDMGNIVCDSNGNVNGFKIQLRQDKMSLSDPARSVLGRAVAIHQNADDFSQPYGNAGPIAASGLIGIANPADAAVAAVKQSSSFEDGKAPTIPTIQKAICSFGDKGSILVADELDIEAGIFKRSVYGSVADLPYGTYKVGIRDNTISAGDHGSLGVELYTLPSLMGGYDGDNNKKYGVQWTTLKTSTVAIESYVGHECVIYDKESHGTVLLHGSMGIAGQTVESNPEASVKTYSFKHIDEYASSKTDGSTNGMGGGTIALIVFGTLAGVALVGGAIYTGMNIRPTTFKNLRGGPGNIPGPPPRSQKTGSSEGLLPGPPAKPVAVKNQMAALPKPKGKMKEGEDALHDRL